jgi:4-hydroxy-3-polyprenylbenzoate decarboxylase
MRVVVGITGASGIRYGVTLVDLLDQTDVESHVILSRNARHVMAVETDLMVEDVETTADVMHNPSNIGASVASGSFDFDGMFVCPCSMKTLGYIANGIAEGLIPRVADVCLKEGRNLVLVPRESPLAHTHVENLEAASRAGAIIAPAAPGFYTNPASIDELVETFAAKLLDRVGVDTEAMTYWSGHPSSQNDTQN